VIQHPMGIITKWAL